MAPRSNHATLAARLAALTAAAALTLAVGQSSSSPAHDHAALAAPVAQTTGGYLATFDNYEVSRPTPYGGPELAVLTTSRGRATWGELEGMTAEHGSMCEPPPATHAELPTEPYADATFVCGGAGNQHLMTAINAGGYAETMLTPPVLADWTSGEVVISFDISTFRASPDRDWWDVWITPFADNLPAPTESFFPDLQGEPRDTLQLTLNPASTVMAHRCLDGACTTLHSRNWAGYPPAPFMPSATRRDRVEIHLTSTTVKWGMPAYNHWWSSPVDGEPITPPLAFSRAVVQFGHHSYNPTKSTKNATDGTPPHPGTWHWDNLAISRAVPFSTIPMTTRAVFEQTQGAPYRLDFAAPAGPDAFLRLNALGEGLQVSTDDGATWAPLRRQWQPGAFQDHFAGYWHPVPVGTRSVLLKTTLAGWWGLGGVNGGAIWSETLDATPPTPTGVPPTPILPPTPEPTETPMPGPTLTPIPPATSTGTPTQTPAATATSVPPTPTPSTYRCQRDTGGGVWADVWTRISGGGCP